MTHRYLKILGILLLAAAVMNMLCGCEKEKTVQAAAVETQEPEKKDLFITATFYPVYALTSMITEGVEGVHVSCLVQPQSGCLRSYSLSDWDTSIAGGSDVIVLAGRGLEAFESTMYAFGDTGPAVITAIYGSALKSYSCANGVSGTHWADPNPFIYLTTEGALSMLAAIEAGIASIDPVYETVYLENLTNVKTQIAELQTQIKDITKPVQGSKVIIMNEAFFGMAEEFGLVVENAWNRESGDSLNEQEAQQCIEALLQCDARVILIEKQAPSSLVERLEANGFIVVRLNTMSSIPASNGKQGWFDAMKENAVTVTKEITKE